MQRRPGILAQTALTFCGQSGGVVASVATGIVIARVLGPAGKGVFSYAVLVLGVFATFGDGLQGAVLRLAGAEGRPRDATFASALAAAMVVALPAMAALVGTGLLVARERPLLWVALALPFALTVAASNGALLLEHDIAGTTLVAAWTTLGFGTAACSALLVLHASLGVVLALWVMASVAACVQALQRVRRRLRPASVQRALMLRALGYWQRAGAAALANFLNLRIDVFVVAFAQDARALGIYSLAVAGGELMWHVSRPLVWTMSGRTAVTARADAAALTAAVTRNALFVVALAGGILFVAAPAAVHLVYGGAYDEAGMIVRWLVPGIVLYGAQGALATFVAVNDGRPLTSLAIRGGSALLCGALTITLLPRIGLIGAALATSFSYTLATVAILRCFTDSTGISVRSVLLLQRADVDRFARLARTAVAPLRDRRLAGER